MKILTLLLLLFSSQTLLAQIDAIELDKKMNSLQSQLEASSKMSSDQRDALEKQRRRLVERSELLLSTDSYIKNYEQNKAKAFTEIEASIKDLNLVQKMGSRAHFYKCLRDSLQKSGSLNYDNCKLTHAPSLSPEEETKAENWKKIAGMTKEEASKGFEKLKTEITDTQKSISLMESTLDRYVMKEQQIKQQIKSTEVKREELKLLPKYEKFTNCDSSTPEINLEEKVPYKGADFQGPFFDIPRDNQDGLGTCFANTAKNLIVGLSGGKDVASFTDLALAYKGNSSRLIQDGIEGGDSCATLEVVRKIGYCPQELSPLENGERNILGEALFNKGPYEYLATNVQMLKDFIQDLDALKRSKSPVKEELLLKAKPMIEKLKSSPDVIFPLPVARISIPSKWKLREAYSWHVSRNRLGTEDDFLKDYDKAYEAFYPAYLEAILAGKKSTEIFATFKSSMADFIKKYQLDSALAEWEEGFKREAEKDLNDPNLQKKMRASVDFLKKMMSKESSPDEDFMKECMSSGDVVRFIAAMSPLIEKLRSNQLNSDKLFDKDGQFKNPRDLMQLTVAPACLNSENRKQLPSFSCESGHETVMAVKRSNKDWNEQKKMFRERVVLSLAQGYALGQSFVFTPPDGRHINTIVGMRFNPQTQSCEIRIRESQTGTSGWHSEDEIFRKMEALTEVRKLK